MSIYVPARTRMIQRTSKIEVFQKSVNNHIKLISFQKKYLSFILSCEKKLQALSINVNFPACIKTTFKIEFLKYEIESLWWCYFGPTAFPSYSAPVLLQHISDDNSILLILRTQELQIFSVCIECPTKHDSWWKVLNVFFHILY